MPKAQTTVSNAAIYDLIVTGKKKGYIDSKTIRELGLDLSELKNPMGRTGQEKLIRLWDCLDSAHRFSPAGLVFGSSVNSSAKGLLASWVSQVDTLGEALTLFIKNIKLMNPEEAWKLRIEGDNAILSFGFRRPNTYPAMAIERSMSAMVTWGRLLSGIQFPLKRVSFSFSEPVYRFEFIKLFGHNISFDTTENEIIFDHRFLASPVVSSNAFLKDQLARRASNALRSLNPSQQTKDVVRDLVEEDLKLSKAISADATARKMGMSRQTLYRRLAREGTSFRSIFDMCRADWAKQLLIENEKSISAISLELGFKDNSSFYKAFERWFGDQPNVCKSRWLAKPFE